MVVDVEEDVVVVLAPVDTYICIDVSIYAYLWRLRKDGEQAMDYDKT